MKLTMLLCALAFAATALLPVAQAQAVNSGSDGSMGELNVTADTVIPLPPDGKLHYTNVMIAEGATVTFVRNALNTPVYLLSTGPVKVAGKIQVSGSDGGPTTIGLGGPGGFIDARANR